MFHEEVQKDASAAPGCTHYFVHQGRCRRNASVELDQQPVVLQVANTARSKGTLENVAFVL